MAKSQSATRSKKVLDQARADLASLGPKRFVEEYRSQGWGNGELAGVMAHAGVRAKHLHEVLNQAAPQSPPPRAAGPSPSAKQSGRIERGLSQVAERVEQVMTRGAAQVDASACWRRDEPRPGPSPVHGKTPAEIQAYRRRQKLQGRAPDGQTRVSLPRELLREGASAAVGLIQGGIELGANYAAMKAESGPLGGPAGLPGSEHRLGRVLGRTLRRLGEITSEGTGTATEGALPPSSAPWLSGLNEATRSLAKDVPEFLLLRAAGKVVTYPGKAAEWVSEKAGQYLESKLLRSVAKEATKAAVQPPYGSVLHGRTKPGEVVQDKVKEAASGVVRGGTKTITRADLPLPGLDEAAETLKKAAEKRTASPKRRKGRRE